MACRVLAETVVTEVAASRVVNTARVVADAFANTSEGSAMVPQHGEWLGNPVAVLRAEPENAAAGAGNSSDMLLLLSDPRYDPHPLGSNLPTLTFKARGAGSGPTWLSTRQLCCMVMCNVSPAESGRLDF